MPRPPLARQTAATATAAENRARALVSLIERRKQRIVEDFYDIGEALNGISS